MTAPVLAPPGAPGPAGRGRRGSLLRAEWTKFRSVRGWLVTALLPGLIVACFGLLTAASSRTECDSGPLGHVCAAVPIGPGGEAVDDRFFFVHRALPGDGSIALHLSSMTGLITYPPPTHDQIVPGLVPWARAGVMIKASTTPGSPYAAAVVTGGHGVRLQYAYTQDVAGPAGGGTSAAPGWLRLTRAGSTLTAAESPDGRAWTTVGSTRLDDLAGPARIGMFVTSPCDLTVVKNSVGGSIGQCRFTETTAVFDAVTVTGAGSGEPWRSDDVGINDPDHHPGHAAQDGDRFTVTGNGDIAPLGTQGGSTVEGTLSGAFLALIVVVVLGVLMISSEYRRGLIRTTLLAGPRRGRVLTAKAAVVGGVTFAVGLVACGITLPVGVHVLRAGGNVVLPVPLTTEIRVVVGTAALLALTAVLALAVGALLRQAVAGVVVTAALVVLPLLLATASVLPPEVSRWILRVTPAAAFAVQQSIPQYPQVINNYVPQMGYYPLPPLAGLAVLCAYAAAALRLAVVALRRRDA